MASVVNSYGSKAALITIYTPYRHLHLRPWYFSSTPRGATTTARACSGGISTDVHHDKECIVLNDKEVTYDADKEQIEKPISVD